MIKMKKIDIKKIKYVIIILIVIMISLLIYFINKDNKESDTNDLSFVEETTKETTTLKQKQYVDIKGNVKNPGVYEFNENDRVIDAINLAGGLKKNANTSNINLSQKLKSEMVIYIYSNEEIKNNENNLSCDTKCKTEVIEVNNCIQNTEKNNDTSKININTATIDELLKISGIGESKAKNIIEYREKNGDFKNIEDIKNINGIGDSLFNKIKDSITI